MPNCSSLWETWRGALKFTSEHAKFIGKVHASQRRAALVDYWIGRIVSFLLILSTYYAGSYLFVADGPGDDTDGPNGGGGSNIDDASQSSPTPTEVFAQPFTMFDDEWNTTKYFHGLLLASAIFVWLLVLKGDFVQDSRLLNLPNAMPPRLPFLAHGQVFWRDYFRSPAVRAWHRLETITRTAQATFNDFGLTRYWLRPWGPPIVYVTSPGSMRQLFMLEEFTELYVGGRACSCMPKALWACGYGHPLLLVRSLLMSKDVKAHDKQCFARHADRLARHVRLLCTNANIRGSGASAGNRARNRAKNSSPEHKQESVAVDFVGVVGEMMLDSICEFALGLEFRASAELRAAFNSACDGASAIFCAPPPAYPFPPWLWRYTSAEGRAVDRSAAIIRAGVAAEVARALALKGSADSNASDINYSRLSLLEHILQSSAERRFTEAEVVEDLTAFMVQRYSVLVPAVIWTLKEVLRAKREGERPGKILIDLIKQARAAETREDEGTAVSAGGAGGAGGKAICGSGPGSSHRHKGKAFGDDVSMPILDRCVREALRLNPPAPALAPLTLFRDVRLNGYKIRKGTEVRVMPYAVQRSEKYWGRGASKELKFEASRWKYASVQTHSPFQHLVFGAGALSCAAPELLRGAVRLYVWTLLREFDMDLDDRLARGAVATAESRGDAYPTPPSRVSILLPRDGFVARVRFRR